MYSRNIVQTTIPAQEQQRLQLVQAALAQNDSQRAVDILLQSIQESPNFLTAYILLAQILLSVAEPDSRTLSEVENIIHIAKSRFPGAPEIAEIEALHQSHKRSPALLESSIEALSKLENKYQGQRCVIVGEGTSLSSMNLSFLKNEISICIGSSYQVLRKQKVEADFIVCTNDVEKIKQCSAELASHRATKFIAQNAILELPSTINFIIRDIQNSSEYFSSDPRNGLVQGSSLYYQAIQLAYFMGFEEIVLIGLDHYLVPSMSSKEDQITQEAEFKIADAFYRAYRGKIIDASVGGHCKVFEKQDYQKVFFPKKQKKALTVKKNLLDFKDIHKGKRVFLVGNGPSLARTPLEKLENEYTFGMNRIALIYPKTGWRPSYFVGTTNYVTRLPDWNYDICESLYLGIDCFVCNEFTDFIPELDTIHLIECTSGHIKTNHAPDEWWSDDITKHVCKFGTSMLPSVQIAAYMGFSEIYLIGCDLGYKKAVNGNDNNHFSDKYDTPGQEGAVTNMHMIAAHELAYRSTQRLGIKMFNATLGGELEVYPRADFYSLFEN